LPLHSKQGKDPMNLRKILQGLLIFFDVLLIISLPTAADSDGICPLPSIPEEIEYNESWRIHWTASNPQTIASKTCIDLSISGGSPPYTWSMSASGFSLMANQTTVTSNTLCADDSACGAAIVSVTDFKEETVTGSVRSTKGKWILIGNDCVIPGPKTRKIQDGLWERVYGRYRQTQSYGKVYWNGTCLHREPPCGNQAYCCIPKPNPGIECIALESTGLIDSYDRHAFPCYWQSPARWTEDTGNPDHSSCIKLGAQGWTSMACIYSGLLRLYEWRCN